MKHSQEVFQVGSTSSENLLSDLNISWECFSLMKVLILTGKKTFIYERADGTVIRLKFNFSR